MQVARPLKAAAVAAMSSMVAAIAIAGPLAGTALAKGGPKPRATMPTVTATPNAPVTKSTSESFSWIPTAGQSYTCTFTLPNLTTQKPSCPSGASFGPGLLDGRYTFSVRITQSQLRAGTYNYSWTVDTTGPAKPTITMSPSSPNDNATGTVGWSDTDASVAGYFCKLTDNTGNVLLGATSCGSAAITGSYAVNPPPQNPS